MLYEVITILEAIIDSFVLVPVGGAQINVSIYELMTAFMKDYFILGFRIVLPMFASILLVNTILAILAKVAPQMNMFAIRITSYNVCYTKLLRMQHGMN